jgi:hypothetical protein
MTSHKDPVYQDKNESKNKRQVKALAMGLQRISELL